MKRKNSQGRSPFVWLVLIAVIFALGYWTWQRRAALAALFPQKAAPVAVEQPVDTVIKQKLKGKLQVIRPPRDPNIGISVDAVALLRSVSIYQWDEHCKGDDCTYALDWSPQHIDSQKFRTPQGHENPRPPFFNARFFAGELRVGDVAIDPALVMAQHPPVDYPVAASALPPNLAATFSVVDGVLYAGGEPAHPVAGMLRVSYRIVPAGEVDVSGLRAGNRLEAE